MSLAHVILRIIYFIKEQQVDTTLGFGTHKAVFSILAFQLFNV